MLRGCVIHIPTMSYGHWCICTPMATFGVVVCYTYRRGASALLASTYRAFPTASNREASDSAGLHAFFMSLREVVLMKNMGCRSPEP